MRVYSGQLGSARAIKINRQTFIGKVPMLLCCCRYRFFLCVLFGAGVLPVFFFRFAGFLFRGIIDLLIHEQRGIHPFDESDRRGIALALPKLDDAGVTAISIGRARRDVSNNFFTASFCRSTASAVRRAWSEPFFPSVTIFSASGRTALALARVVLIR